MPSVKKAFAEHVREVVNMKVQFPFIFLKCIATWKMFPHNNIIAIHADSIHTGPTPVLSQL